MVNPPNAANPQQPVNQQPLSPQDERYLLASYRVGMLALENLGRKISEDRPKDKYARNPSYGEDVKWLLGVSRKLGLAYVEKYLLYLMSSIMSPFLLQELVWECGVRTMTIIQIIPICRIR